MVLLTIEGVPLQLLSLTTDSEAVFSNYLALVSRHHLAEALKNGALATKQGLSGTSVIDRIHHVRCRWGGSELVAPHEVARAVQNFDDHLMPFVVDWLNYIIK